jgi:probable HAF family extracellular repeat protein
MTAPEYSITDLGGLSAGLACTPAGINDNGDIVGLGELPGFRFHAILRRLNGQITDLGTLNGPGVNSLARAINRRGTIVGGSKIDEETSHAFLMEPGGRMVDLGIEHLFKDRRYLPDEPSQRMEIRAVSLRSRLGRITSGGFPTMANAINDIDQVVGDFFFGGCFFYSASQGIVDLKTLGGFLSSAHGINNSHQVVGWSDTRDGEQRAFLHDASSGVPLQPVDALPSLGGTASAAYSINEQGDVVGDSATEGNSKEHAFLYRKGALRDLGTLGGDTSYATAINNNGSIVGYSNKHAFVYVNDKMHDLNDLIPPNTDWVLHQALSINSRGQITGWGYVADKFRGFLLTPV